MKKTFVTLFATVATVVTLHSFRTIEDSSITGKVNPADGVEYVYAISGTDSLKTTATDGAFSITAKAGIYKVVVDAKDPYKDATYDNVEVKDGQNTDLGEINLQQ
jgi:hypothetical protein